MSKTEQTSVGRCEMCGREKALTFHHLIPRTLHANKWFKKNRTRAAMQRGIRICRDCHDAIHRHIDEKALGRQYDSLEKLLSHPEIAKFVQWVARR